MVAFYGPDCQDCKALAGPINKSAKALKNQADQDLPIMYVAKVDVSESPKLKERFNITDLPAIWWLIDGDATPYKGRHTYEGMVNAALKRVDSSFA